MKIDPLEQQRELARQLRAPSDTVLAKAPPPPPPPRPESSEERRRRKQLEDLGA